MVDDKTDVATLSRTTFSLVIKELHQKFTDKNHDNYFTDDSRSASSGFGSLFTEIDDEQPKIIKTLLDQILEAKDNLKPIPVSVSCTPAPRPEAIFGWQNESYLTGGMTRHTNYIDTDTDMTDRFIIVLKPRKEKRGLLSRLKFWKKKRSQDISSDEIKNKDKKNCGVWRLLCCCSHAE